MYAICQWHQITNFCHWGEKNKNLARIRKKNYWSVAFFLTGWQFRSCQMFKITTWCVQFIPIYFIIIHYVSLYTLDHYVSLKIDSYRCLVLVNLHPAEISGFHGRNCRYLVIRHGWMSQDPTSPHHSEATSLGGTTLTSFFDLTYGGFRKNRGTPVHHPFYWDFPL